MFSRLRVSLLGLIAVAGGACLPASAHAAAAPVILSLSYDSTFASHYIGTTLNAYATAILPSPAQPYSVSVTSSVAGPSGSVTLGGLFAGVVPSPSNLYVSDGTRAWVVAYTSGNSITLDNAALLGGAYVPPSWVVSDYALEANSTFTVYGGTLVTDATAGAQLTVTIGQISPMLVLNDSGTNGDVHAGDGIWTSVFTVPNNGTEVTGANLFASCEVAGTPAVNGNFESAQTVNLDMELPQILTTAYTTSNSAYNGDLYLSTLSQGLSAANPADVLPSDAEARFTFTVNKPDTLVDIYIGGPGGAYPLVTKHLPSFIFPNGATSLSGWLDWVGDDGNQVFAQDGIYPVTYAIHDTDGLYGATLTSRIKVVSLHMAISDITLAPPSIGTQPAVSAGVLTTIGYNVTLTNDTGDPAKMNSSLHVLGWADAGQTSATFVDAQGQTVTAAINGINSVSDAESTVWTMQTRGTLSPTGTFTAFAPGTDTSDWDTTESVFLFPYLALFSADNPQTTAAESCTSTPLPTGTFMVTGDGNAADDWAPKGFLPLGTVNGVAPASPWGFTSSLAPANLSAQVVFSWDGATPAQGNYRIDLQSQLTGLAIGGGPPANPSLDMADPCTPSAGSRFVSVPYHFWPQSQLDQPGNVAWGGQVQGDQIYTQNASAIFVVNATGSTTSDNTPPEFLTSNPAQNSINPPNAYSATSLSTELSVEFQDQSTAFNLSGGVSYITLTGPNGVNISGQSQTNGASPNGTMEIYFAPTQPLATGGSYDMEAFTCNNAGLCAQQSVPFTVRDTTAPQIASNGVVLTSQGGATNALSLFQSAPQGPYQDVTGVSVTLVIPSTSTNTIDFTDSNVSLYQVSGTAQIAVPMTRQADSGDTASQGTLNYALDTPINSSGLYEVITQSFSVDASGNRYVGPPALSSGTNSPEFTTSPCLLCFSREYTNNPNPNRLAFTGQYPVTVTSQGVVTVTAAVTAAKPAALPPDAGYAFLATANNNNELQFFLNGVGLATPLVWSYPLATPLTFQLYYDESDLQATTQTGAVVTASDLQVVGYDGSSWHQIANAALPVSPTTSNNACVVTAPDGSPSYVYYAIAYPSSLTRSTGTGTPVAQPTPMTFPSTRAFNPNNSNPLYSEARFYYGTVAPESLDVRIYDTGGRLVRAMSLGDGVSASSFTTDPVYGNSAYYFAWNGRNDDGVMVRNGIYLVRWSEAGTDGSHNSGTKPVALIK